MEVDASGLATVDKHYHAQYTDCSYITTYCGKHKVRLGPPTRSEQQPAKLYNYTCHNIIVDSKPIEVMLSNSQTIYIIVTVNEGSVIPGTH